MTGRVAFLCAGVRTPIGRFGGALSSVRPDDLAAVVIRELLERVPALDPTAIDEVILGCANQAGEDNRNVARMATLIAGLPVSVPGITVNRLCASGLSAVASAGHAIVAGDADVVIAGGVESMSRAPWVMAKPARAFDRSPVVHDTTLGWRFVNPRLEERHGVDTMVHTAENVAREFHVSRGDQDAFALWSQRKASAAQRERRFADEICPVRVTGGRGAEHPVTEDESPRPDTTLEALRTLRPVVDSQGSVTAGNSSGINDGACALLVASSDAVRTFGLTPLARIVACASAGVPPRLMGIGPVEATRKVLARAGLRLADLDVIELNEAFASQALAVLRELGLSDTLPVVNRWGGAIALGHPLGMSGARLALTAARQLNVLGGRFALCTMCVGVGQGVAVALERA